MREGDVRGRCIAEGGGTQPPRYHTNHSLINATRQPGRKKKRDIVRETRAREGLTYVQHIYILEKVKRIL